MKRTNLWGNGDASASPPSSRKRGAWDLSWVNSYSSKKMPISSNLRQRKCLTLKKAKEDQELIQDLRMWPAYYPFRDEEPENKTGGTDLNLPQAYHQASSKLRRRSVTDPHCFTGPPTRSRARREAPGKEFATSSLWGRRTRRGVRRSPLLIKTPTPEQLYAAGQHGGPVVSTAASRTNLSRPLVWSLHVPLCQQGFSPCFGFLTLQRHETEVNWTLQITPNQSKLFKIKVLLL